MSDMAMTDEEMIEILEEIARSGKSQGARLSAIDKLQKMREAKHGDAVPAAAAEKADGFDGLYDVENPGRVRRAS